MPGGLIVTELSPAKAVTVTLRGPRTILDSVDGEKTRLVVDLSNATEGKVSIDLEPGDDESRAAAAPEGGPHVADAPASAKLERLAKRRLPVTASLAGDPTLGYTADEHGDSRPRRGDGTCQHGR